ncbi:MAG: DUF748 domain-containing protein [Pseudomonadota bacterium]
MNAASLRHKKWVRRAAVLLLAWLALWLLAWLAVPPLVKSQLQRIASEKLGRQVTVGSVDFKPWTLELTLNDLRIAGTGGSDPQLEIRRLYADAELQSILRLAPVIDSLQVDAPAVRLTRLADGRYDIDDIAAKLASPPDAPSGAAPRFAVYNIAISGGSIDFDDQTIKRQHTVRDLTLQVPVLSNLGAERDVQTEPRLAFMVNGSAFDSKALALPFAENRKTDAHLSFKGLDLAPYLGYMPAGLPVQLQSGTLDADLQVDFERAATGALKVTGTVQAHGVKVADARAHDLLAFQSLKLELTDVRPLEGVFQFGEISLDEPRLMVARDGSGRLDLLATDPATGKTEKPVAQAPAVVASAPAAKPSRPPVSVAVAKLRLKGGEIGWRDATTQPAAAIDLTQLAVEASAIGWPMENPAQFNGSALVGGAGIKFKGEATDKRADVQTDVASLPLSLAAPYLAQSLVPSLDGKLSGQIDVAWAAPNLRLKARRLAADGLALTQAKTAVASVGRFELVDAEADMTKHTLAIASVTATNPKVSVERDNQRRWMFERWLRTPDGAQAAPVAAPKPAEAEVPPAGANTQPWRLSIDSLAVEGGAVSYSDKAIATPIAVEVSDLRINLQKLAPGTNAVSPLQVSGRIAAGRADPGRVDYKGSLVLAPLSVDGRLEVAAVPAHAFKAYYADALNIDIRRAFASYRGTFRLASTPAGVDVRLAGDSALEDFRANSAELTQSQSPGLERANNQLLGWKALGLRGMQVAVVPGAPLTVDVRETTLTDFFARVIVEPNGRLNLQNLTRKSAAEAPAAVPAETQREPDGATVTTRPPVATEARKDNTSPRLNFGPMSLVNGRIDFTDQFVKPNYSADLSELTGRLSAFSSQPASPEAGMAELELRGKAQQTAALDITGKINPLAKPLQLDITAKMRDLDLAPLTPYSVRYAGHGIERGKLSMDVNYQVTGDGRLTATNKLVLNQLQFGEEVKGAPNSLPVRLAVALLTDRNGVIDVEIPLSGSLNDPQFSVGSLIVKAIGNLIVKAVTAPFSLLTGGFGGGTIESSAIAFEPGLSALPPQAGANLDKIAKALNDRPALQMTVVGTASLEKEGDAYKRQRLRQLTLSEKRRAAVRAGQPATADVAPVTDAEYPALLTAVYKRADITKPRNLLGLAKDLPEKEMEDLLLASISVTEESMRQLAVERGAAVRDYLLVQQVPSGKLFLGAVRTGATNASWKPAAELNLATR